LLLNSNFKYFDGLFFTMLRNGHEIVALVNLRPPHSISIRNETKNNDDEISICQELDSYMYQSVGNVFVFYFSFYYKSKFI